MSEPYTLDATGTILLVGLTIVCWILFEILFKIMDRKSKGE